jgi:starch phosphorylase
MFFFRTVSVNPPIPERIIRIREIANNYWFSWNPAAQELFSYINEGLWEEVNHNPVQFLINIDPEDLERVSQDPDYQFRYDRVISEFDRYMHEPKWFEQAYPQHDGRVIAYFCAEFGLHESLPIYSGGLGVLAGDHVKAASDLGLPFVGVGLLYKHGYFTQRINREGWQEARYPHLTFREMPMTPVTRQNGSDLLVEVDFRHKIVYLKIWQVQVGRVRLYLLDADISRNNNEDRKLTSRLYGGDDENRIKQEILLGMGGVKALRAMNIEPFAWHMNEGHAAFSTVERLRELVHLGIPINSAKEAVKSNTIFTTHTPVPAGHDIFSPELVDSCLGHIYNQLGITRGAFMDLGMKKGDKGFNMTLLAMRLSGYCNGVSKLHGEVSRKMFHDVYPHLSVDEVPIGSITNGVHLESWLSDEMKELITIHLGPDWTTNLNDKQMWEKIRMIPDNELWDVHRGNKVKTIEYIRNMLLEKRTRNREDEYRLREVEHFLNPEILTIGFARRFTTYKRATLIFRNKERLAGIMNNPDMPLQLVFAGKAHPKDAEGHRLIKEIYEISNEEPFRGKIVFLEDYSINTARHLIQGVDVWLNNPRWPMEASGTSGMKAAANGVLHCSVLDGWWPEAFDGHNGFAIGGNSSDYHEEELQDINDSEQLYDLLETVILPAYYQRENGLPHKWLYWMKNSMVTIPPVFNTRRMVQEYTDKYYVKLIERGISFAENNYELADRVKNYKQNIEENWHHVAIKAVNCDGCADMQRGEQLNLQANVKLGPIKQEDIITEIAYGVEDSEGLRNVVTVPMQVESQTGEGEYMFTGGIPLEFQGTLGYTVRVRPSNKNLAHQYEVPLATWAPDF